MFSLFDFANLGKFFFSNGRIYEGESKGWNGTGLGYKTDLIRLSSVYKYFSFNSKVCSYSAMETDMREQLKMEK